MRYIDDKKKLASLIEKMCLFLGIGSGAIPANQYYSDGYFARSLDSTIKESGYTWEEIEYAARKEARQNKDV